MRAWEQRLLQKRLVVLQVIVVRVNPEVGGRRRVAAEMVFQDVAGESGQLGGACTLCRRPLAAATARRHTHERNYETDHEVAVTT